MIVSIHQPSYWPWLGLLDKISRSDRFIVLDNVEANKSAYQYRNIFYCNGKEKFITLPVDYRMGTRINELAFKNDDWAKDHLARFRNYYLKTPFFREIFPLVETLYSAGYDRPVDLIFATMDFSFKILEIETEILFSSALDGKGSKAEIVLDLLRKSGATIYLSGKGALDYFTDHDTSEFKRNGIDITWQDFNHPVYEQFPSSPFIAGLGCLDLFFFHGVDRSKKIFHER
ncbi:MAG: WbqC family protein [Candidatus Krumholzibacteriota bacterium]|nr:WbqC family protein [Candidatus Krumholzibacteriota bacterium]